MGFNTTFASENSPCNALARIFQAQRVVTDAQGRVVRETVSLPDVLPSSARRPDVQVGYLVDVSACANAPRTAIYSYRTGAPFEVEWIDGAGVARALPTWLPTAGVRAQLVGALSRQQVSNGRAPMVFLLPLGARQLHFSLRTMAYIPAGLTLLTLGPADDLAAWQDRDFSSLAYGSDLVAGFSAFLAVLAVLLSLWRRQDKALRWFALGCALWGVRNLLYLSPVLPGAGFAAESFLSFGVTGCVVSMLMCLAYTNMPQAHRLRSVLAWGLAGVALVYVLGFVLPALAAVARLVSFGGTTLAIFWVIGALLRAPPGGMSRGALYFVVLILAGVIVMGMMDFAIVMGARAPQATIYAFWGFTALVIAITLMSGARVVASLNRSEQVNAELEQTIATKSAELEQLYAFERERELHRERESARGEERERLTREMHDGVGAQLMTALRGVERGAFSSAQLAQALQDGLDELRLLMDSADMGRSLQGALAAWRNRWDARLSAAGLVLVWQVDDGVEKVALAEDVVMQLMRMLQEAVTNVVKHARAQTITVSARVAQGVLQVVVQDDGVGLPAPTDTGDPVDRSHRGLRNLYQRAAQMGGAVVVRSQTPPLAGTVVEISLPMLVGVVT